MRSQERNSSANLAERTHTLAHFQVHHHSLHQPPWTDLSLVVAVFTRDDGTASVRLWLLPPSSSPSLFLLLLLLPPSVMI